MEFSKVKKPAVVSNGPHAGSQHIWSSKYVELFTAGDFTTGAYLSQIEKNAKLMCLVGVFVCMPWFTTEP